MNQETSHKLHELNLGGMIENYEMQEHDASFEALSFEDRFKLMVDYEYTRRQNNKLQRLMKQATFHDPHASMDDIEYYPDRKLDRTTFTELSTGNYINEHHNIILMGASGNGKTWIANALGVQACRQLKKVKYIRLPELLDELLAARDNPEGNFRKVLKKYVNYDLLILDEWLLVPLDLQLSTFVLELVEKRIGVGSTIFCSQFDPKGWYQKLANEQLADAILDRIVHDSYKIQIGGDVSMRQRHGLKGVDND